MKTPIQVLALALPAILAAAPAARADVDVAAKVEQLKANVDASRDNLAQYEDAAKTVELNGQENERALKALAKQRDALNREMAATAQGKGGLAAAKAQVEAYKKAELEKIASEAKQAEALRQALAKLEDAAKRREANVAAYDEKLRSIDADGGAWSQRSQAVAEADKALKQKEAVAAADKKQLAEKRARYAAEIDSWKQKSRVADRQYANFSKLKEE